MSILSSLLRDVAALFFPPRCPVCGRMLAQGEHTVCTLCRATAPLTGFWRQADNPVLGRCRDMLPVERASGLLYYVHGSGWRELIRGFKYRGAWRAAREMGAWYGRCLKESGLYDDVEAILPLADFVTVHLPKTKETIEIPATRVPVFKAGKALKDAVAE